MDANEREQIECHVPPKDRGVVSVKACRLREGLYGVRRRADGALAVSKRLAVHSQSGVAVRSGLCHRTPNSPLEFTHKKRGMDRTSLEFCGYAACLYA